MIVTGSNVREIGEKLEKLSNEELLGAIEIIAECYKRRFYTLVDISHVVDKAILTSNKFNNTKKKFYFTASAIGIIETALLILIFVRLY